MKLLLSRTCLIVGLAFCLLVLVSCGAVPQKRYTHEHLQTSALEPRAKLLTVDYTISDGETLASVAKRRYGHQNYYRVIKLYNHVEDERQVAPNQKLRLPDISVILNEEGVTKVAAQEVALILCSRAKYDQVVDRLWSLPNRSPGPYQLNDNLKRHLLEAADDLQQATESLKQTKPGVNGVPSKMIGQLEQAMTGMQQMADGHFDSYGYDIDMVQQRYALATTNAIIWAREGFK
ncbi:MAG: hypothetical protein V7638_2647 [Acidobacteriota bacterium]|jgi:hypothetical protein